uniref:Putative secreted peptide n=1 Tax=Anopheles braziliensis TaxID=58242 RepID=A0A2M3ZTA3_9DIPT
MSCGSSFTLGFISLSFTAAFCRPASLAAFGGRPRKPGFQALPGSGHLLAGCWCCSSSMISSGSILIASSGGNCSSASTSSCGLCIGGLPMSANARRSLDASRTATVLLEAAPADLASSDLADSPADGFNRVREEATSSGCGPCLRRFFFSDRDCGVRSMHSSSYRFSIASML